MQYIKFGDYYLTEQIIPAASQPTAPAPVNHLWLVDRSGSMWGLISDLIDDLQNQVHKIPAGDTITFGYFSSEGQYRFVVKGFRLKEPSDYEQFIEMLNSYRSTLSLTCFSEILEDSYSVLEELSWISSQFSLWLFTDGYPVVRNTQSEEKRIAAALKRLNSRLVAAQFIGYGDYYNKELMAQMAEWAGGSLRHCSQLRDSSSAMEEFINTMPNSPRTEVSTLYNSDLIFTVHSGITSYAVEDGKILVTPPEKGALRIYYVTQETPANGEDELVVQGVMYDRLISASYAAAALLNQRGRGDLALELMGAIGDVNAVNLLTNSFTLAENGEVENQLIETYKSPTALAWLQGYQPNCTPAFDAFCVLDLIELLSEGEAYFYPRHPEFNYKRTGRKAVQLEGYPKFIADVNVRCKISNLVWNESTLNLSVLLKLYGTVDLGEEAAAVGLPETFHTFQWRTYTIIRDGALWTTTLPISAPAGVWSKLQNVGLVSANNQWEEGKIAVIDLSSLPLINRKIANSVLTPTAATDLARQAIEMENWGAYLKVYKQLLKELEPEKESLPDTFTEEQKSFLEAKGISAKGYRPPDKKEDPTDVYVTRTFQVAVKGWSSLPKVDEVRAKVEGEKKLNAPSAAMAKALAQYDAAKELLLTDDKRIAVLQDYIETGLLTQRKLRAGIQRAKFSVILGRRWFPEFSSRQENSLTVDGQVVTFTEGLKEIKV